MNEELKNTLKENALSELDFESFNNLINDVSSSETGVQLLTNPVAVTKTVLPPNDSIFSKHSMDVLKKGSISFLSAQSSKKHVPQDLPSQSLKIPIHVVSTKLISGFKKPSHLGENLIKTSILRVSTKNYPIDTLIYKLPEIFVRARSTTNYSWYSSNDRLKAFQFDIPEPVTFDSRKTAAAGTSTKWMLPAPRLKKQPVGTHYFTAMCHILHWCYSYSLVTIK